MRRLSLSLGAVRSFATSSADSGQVLLEGKTQSVLISLLKKYKYYVLAAGGVVATVGVFGMVASAMAIGGLASVAGGMLYWYKRRIKKQQTVLRLLYEPLIDLNRQQIEQLIGPFDLPDARTIASDSATSTSPSGGVEILIRNVFYIDGTSGKALVRVMGVKNRDGTCSLRKLIVDAVDYRRSMQERVTLVDEVPKLDYVDSPSFTTYTLDQFLGIKNAALQANINSQRERTRQEAALKERAHEASSSSSKSQKLYSNKPPKQQVNSERQ